MNPFRSSPVAVVRLGVVRLGVVRLGVVRLGVVRLGVVWLGVALPFGTPAAAQDELVPLVIDLLDDPDKDVRALGLEQVRTQAQGEAATKRFAAELVKLPPDAQVGLLRALGDRGDAAALPEIRDLWEANPEASVRVAVLGAIGSLGGVEDLPVLIGVLGEASGAEEAAARKSLERLRGETVSAALAEAMKSAEETTRIDLIEVLTARRADETTPAILAAAVDDDPDIRAAAMRSLGQLAGPRDLTGMVRALLTSEPGRERADAEKAIMFVCERIEDPRSRAEPLIAAIDRLPPARRPDLLSTLGRVGGPEARARIEAAIRDSDPTMHDLGIRALCNWPDAGIADRLKQLATSERKEGHRRMALRALIRVAPLPDDRTDQQRLALLKEAMSMCRRDADRNLALDRARAIRTPDSLRFILPYVDRPPLAEQACESIVELAHHRGLREPNKPEFDQALDKVIETSKDAVVIDRAKRYKNGQTWVRPKS